MASLKSLPFLFFLLVSSASSSSLTPDARRVCETTPFPDACFDSLKLSLSISVNVTVSPKTLSFVLQTLKSAVSDGAKLSAFLSKVVLVETQRGTVDDCRELQEITLSVLKKSLAGISSLDRRKVADLRTSLSAALTNRATCLEGLGSATGAEKSAVVDAVESNYRHVSNSLSLLSGAGFDGVLRNRRLMGFPRWVSRAARRVLVGNGEEYDSGQVLTVAADGSGNFTTVSAAVEFAPSNSDDRVIIFVRGGVYEENVEIPSWKTNIVLIGDGSDATVITGNRSVGDGWTTFRSATVAVSGEGFLARDIRFENTAGPEKHQAVALRINADYAAVYRCTIAGYQDTLYTHSFRQFFRECDIYGTVDYIFGNAAVVFQGCTVVSRMPMAGQFTAVTAQGRESPDENTGISLQNCTILATDELYSNSSAVKSYLGRPWKNFSTTVVLESYVDDFIAPEGWAKWGGGDDGLDTLYYGEYQNNGPGSAVDRRVSWPGFHVMDYSDAANFTVSEFITGQDWLDSTSFPYDDYV